MHSTRTNDTTGTILGNDNKNAAFTKRRSAIARSILNAAFIVCLFISILSPWLVLTQLMAWAVFALFVVNMLFLSAQHQFIKRSNKKANCDIEFLNKLEFILAASKDGANEAARLAAIAMDSVDIHSSEVKRVPGWQKIPQEELKRQTLLLIHLAVHGETVHMVLDSVFQSEPRRHLCVPDGGLRPKVSLALAAFFLRHCIQATMAQAKKRFGT